MDNQETHNGSAQREDFGEPCVKSSPPSKRKEKLTKGSKEAHEVVESKESLSNPPTESESIAASSTVSKDQEDKTPEVEVEIIEVKETKPKIKKEKSREGDNETKKIKSEPKPAGNPTTSLSNSEPIIIENKSREKFSSDSSDVPKRTGSGSHKGTRDGKEMRRSKDSPRDIKPKGMKASSEQPTPTTSPKEPNTAVPEHRIKQFKGSSSSKDKPKEYAPEESLRLAKEALGL